MTAIIVSDTTSLIVLEKLQALPLLCHLFSRVLIPEVVLAELQAGSPHIHELIEQLACLEVVTVPVSRRLESLLLLLDAGEANAIELAVSRHLPLIIDERKGRQIAHQFGLKITGFAGLLIQAVRHGVIDRDTALEYLDQAMMNGLRLSDPLLRQVREALGKIS